MQWEFENLLLGDNELSPTAKIRNNNGHTFTGKIRTLHKDSFLGHFSVKRLQY